MYQTWRYIASRTGQTEKGFFFEEMPMFFHTHSTASGMVLEHVRNQFIYWTAVTVYVANLYHKSDCIQSMNFNEFLCYSGLVWLQSIVGPLFQVAHNDTCLSSTVGNINSFDCWWLYGKRGKYLYIKKEIIILQLITSSTQFCAVDAPPHKYSSWTSYLALWFVLLCNSIKRWEFLVKS